VQAPEVAHEWSPIEPDREAQRAMALDPSVQRVLGMAALVL